MWRGVARRTAAPVAAAARPARGTATAAATVVLTAAAGGGGGGGVTAAAAAARAGTAASTALLTATVPAVRAVAAAAAAATAATAAATARTVEATPRLNLAVKVQALTANARAPVVVVWMQRAAYAAWWVVDWIATLAQGLRIIFVLILPTVTLYLLTTQDGRWHPVLYRSIVRTLQWCGPTFIKLGQWGATRPDILPPELCTELSKLHEGVKAHSLAYTKRIIQEDFGCALEDAFVSFQPTPVGSGCIAQVYRAVLRAADGSDNHTTVAVKVRHPYVETIIRRDIRLMHIVAALVHGLLPSFEWLSFPDVVDNFADAMQSQLDLRREGYQLDRFARNFAKFPQVVFPRPVWPWVSERVLMETYEEGVPVSVFLRQQAGIHNSRIAKTGLTSFLKMVLQDNFIHADLHPGNIMVRIGRRDDPQPLQVIFLDAGLVTELSDIDRRNFIELFSAVAIGNGRRAGELMIDRSRGKKHVVDPEGFINRMNELVKQVQTATFRLEIVDVGKVLEEVMSLVRKHHIRIETNFTNLVMGIAILEGLGRRLDPNVDIFSAAIPILRKVHPDYILYAPGANVMLRLREWALRAYHTIANTPDVL